MANTEIYTDLLTNGVNVVGLDADSTLYPFEVVDELARVKGVYHRVAEITQKAMEGKILFDAAFRERYEVIRPSRHDLQSEGERAAGMVNPNVASAFKLLQEYKVECHIISGGCLEGLYPLMQAIPVQKKNIHANQILFDDGGAYTGYDAENSLCQDKGKPRVIDGITKDGSFMMVGDGITDKEVEEYTHDSRGFVIAYGGVVRRPWFYDQPLGIWTPDVAAVFPLALGVNRWKDVYNRDSESRDLLWQGLCQLSYGTNIATRLSWYKEKVGKFLADNHDNYVKLSMS
jgi:HAD superfamily phosphoserine phosphatase-like hydrolase